MNKTYFGIIIENSLRDKSIITFFSVLSMKKIGSWNFLLVSVTENDLERQIQILQQNMIKIEDDCWYAHFFSDQTLIVVFENLTFKVATNPDTWEEVIKYGLSYNVPIEQLDFKPRTKKAALNFFELQ